MRRDQQVLEFSNSILFPAMSQFYDLPIKERGDSHHHQNQEQKQSSAARTQSIFVGRGINTVLGRSGYESLFFLSTCLCKPALHLLDKPLNNLSDRNTHQTILSTRTTTQSQFGARAYQVPNKSRQIGAWGLGHGGRGKNHMILEAIAINEESKCNTAFRAV